MQFDFGQRLSYDTINFCISRDIPEETAIVHETEIVASTVASATIGSMLHTRIILFRLCSRRKKKASDKHASSTSDFAQDEKKKRETSLVLPSVYQFRH